MSLNSGADAGPPGEPRTPPHPRPQNAPIAASTGSQTKASWIFGSLLVVFLLGVFMFAPAELPEFKLRILAFVCALIAGLFALFIAGTLLLHAELPIPGKWTVQGSAGIALFLIVLFWWYGPFAPVKSTKTDTNGLPARDANQQAPAPSSPVGAADTRGPGQAMVPPKSRTDPARNLRAERATEPESVARVQDSAKRSDSEQLQSAAESMPASGTIVSPSQLSPPPAQAGASIAQRDALSSQPAAAPVSQPNAADITPGAIPSQPAGAAAVAGAAGSSAALSADPPDPCPHLTKFKLDDGEFYPIAIHSLKYDIYLKGVSNHLGRKSTAEIYVLPGNNAQWDTRQVPKKEFESTIKLLRRSTVSKIDNDQYGDFELDDTSDKQITTPSAHSFWIKVKTHALSASFEVCAD